MTQEAPAPEPPRVRVVKEGLTGARYELVSGDGGTLHVFRNKHELVTFIENAVSCLRF